MPANAEAAVAATPAVAPPANSPVEGSSSPAQPSNGAAPGNPAAQPAETPAAKVEASEATKPVEAKAEEKKDKPLDNNSRLAKGFASLHKKEKTIIEEQRKISEVKEKMTADYQHLVGLRKSLQQATENARRNPRAYLAAVGLTYDDVTQWELNNGEVPEEQRPALELAEAKALAKKAMDGLEGFKKQQAENAEKAKQRAAQMAEEDNVKKLAMFRGRAVAFVGQNAVDYPLLNQFEDQQSLVPELMEEMFETQGRRLTMKEAADMVENHLAEQVEKATSQEAWKKRQEAKQPKPVVVAEPEEVAPAKKTLTNSLTATSKPVTKTKQLTEDELVARAVAKYNEVAGKK